MKKGNGVPASILFTQTVWLGPNVTFCQSCLPWSLRWTTVEMCYQELDGVRPSNLGFVNCPLPQAQFSPRAYCYLNTSHSYISMVSFCVFTPCNAINVLMCQNELVQVAAEVMRRKKICLLCQKVGETLATPTHTNRKMQERLSIFWQADVTTMDMWEVTFLTLGMTSTTFHTG